MDFPVITFQTTISGPRSWDILFYGVQQYGLWAFFSLFQASVSNLGDRLTHTLTAERCVTSLKDGKKVLIDFNTFNFIVLFPLAADEYTANYNDDDQHRQPHRDEDDDGIQSLRIFGTEGWTHLCIKGIFRVRTHRGKRIVVSVICVSLLSDFSYKRHIIFQYLHVRSCLEQHTVLIVSWALGVSNWKTNRKGTNLSLLKGVWALTALLLSFHHDMFV